MSSTAEVLEASITGPIASLTTATGALVGVARYATATTNTPVALPTVTRDDGRVVVPLQGKFLRVANESASAALEFAFGTSSPTLVFGQVATFATGHVSAGWQIAPQSFQDFIVPVGATHVAFIQPSGATASTVAFYCSSGQVDGR